MLVHQKTLFNGVTTCWAWFFQYGLKELQSSDVNNGGCAPPQPIIPPTQKVRGFLRLWMRAIGLTFVIPAGLGVLSTF